MRQFSGQLFMALFSVVIISISCAPSRFVKPLEDNQSAVNVAIGGPLIEYGTSTIPIPFLTATYGYGIDSSLTIFGGLNITSALYENLQVEVGIVKQLMNQKRYYPAITISPVINFIYHDPSPHPHPFYQ